MAASHAPLSVTATGAAPAGRRVGVWRTVLACEWRLLRGDAGWWLGMALMALCVGYALSSGQARLAERAAAVQAAQQDEVQRLKTLGTQLAALDATGRPFAGESFRDPSNALAVGRGSAAPVLVMQPAPLAVLSVGLSDLYPPSFKVSAGSRDRFLFVDEIANPALLSGGSFDIAFVVVYLYPLLLLALSYNVLSGEHEQGTLALTQATSAPLSSVLMAKLLLRGGGIAVALLLALAVGLQATRALPATADAAGAAATLALAVLLYGALWLALALWLNTWRRDSAYNAVALVGAWLLLLLVLPAAINALAQVLHPAPARAEMVLAVRQAAIDADRDRQAEQTRFAQEHGLPAPGAASTPAGTAAQRRTLALLLAADARADAVLDRHDGLVRRQRQFTDTLAYSAPPMLMNDLLAELAGNGHTRWDAQLASVAAFHERWQGYFVAIAQRGTALTRADLAAMPRVSSAAVPVWTAASTARVVPALAWLALWTVALLWLSRRRLSRAA